MDKCINFGGFMGYRFDDEKLVKQGAMWQAILLPNQVGTTASRVWFYDATAAMLTAIAPQKPLAFRPVYDATAAMLKALVWP
jgi:hypothetical protein